MKFSVISFNMNVIYYDFELDVYIVRQRERRGKKIII